MAGTAKAWSLGGWCHGPLHWSLTACLLRQAALTPRHGSDTLIQVLCPGRARLRAQHTPRSKAPIYNSSCQDLEKCRSSSYSSVLEGGDSSALWSKRFSSLETMPSHYVTTDWPLSCQEFNAANHVVS